MIKSKNKPFQLVLARRERDTNKDALTNFEKQVTDERNNLKVKEKSANESTEKVKELVSFISPLCFTYPH